MESWRFALWRGLPGRVDVLLNLGGRNERAVNPVDVNCLSRWWYHITQCSDWKRRTSYAGSGYRKCDPLPQRVNLKDVVMVCLLLIVQLSLLTYTNTAVTVNYTSEYIRKRRAGFSFLFAKWKVCKINELKNCIPKEKMEVFLEVRTYDPGSWNHVFLPLNQCRSFLSPKWQEGDVTFM